MWWKRESAYPTLWKSQQKGGYAGEERIPLAIETIVQLMGQVTVLGIECYSHLIRGLVRHARPIWVYLLS